MSETTKKHKAQAPKKLKFGIFIVSTSRYSQLKKGQEIQDPSGDMIESSLTKAGHSVLFRKTIPDDKTMISDSARQSINSGNLDAVIYCGGTGVAPSDVTIETLTPLMEKPLPGFGEIFRRLSYDQIGSPAVMSRATAGVINRKAIFCLPGSPDAVQLCLSNLILPETGHIVKHARE
jgi:molybdenum cofactor biosynthesis protein B